MVKVINKNGYELGFEAAAQYMDAKISDTVSMEHPFANFQAYEEAHEKATGEEWFLSSSNPVW